MKIEKCPFCGGEAIVVKTESCGRYIGCWDCGGRTEEFETDYAGSAHDKAISAWNRRTDHIRDTTKMVSNADRIRSTSDKELAEYIFALGNGSEYCYGHCAYQDDCATKGLDYDTCIKGVIDWLKQPVKEEV